MELDWLGPLLFLTNGAEMRSAPCQQDSPNGRTAYETGLAGSQINAMLQLKETLHSVRIHLVGD